MSISGRWTWAVLLGLAGGGTSAPPTDTGARKAVEDYCDALVQRDWARAYALVHPDSRRLWPAGRFSRSAEVYWRRIGFEPRQAQVRSCEEQGTQAIAHIVFTGVGPSRHQRYREGLILRPCAEGWRIVPASNFGK